MNCPCGFCSDWNSTIGCALARALRKAAIFLPTAGYGCRVCGELPNPWCAGRQVSSEFLPLNPRTQGIMVGKWRNIFDKL